MIRAILLAVALLASGRARAEASDPERQSARAREAQGEYDQGHYQKALELFEKDYQDDPQPLLLFRIAQCHRRMGQLKQAADTYRAFLRKADLQSRDAQRAEDLLDEVEDAIRRGTAGAAPASRPWMPSVVQPAAPPSHKTAFVLGGVAVAAVAVGAVLGLESRNAGNDLSAAVHPQSQAQSLLKTKRDTAIVADGLFVLSALLASGAVIAW